MAQWLPHVRVKICQGIGGTLDTIVGSVRRAPWLFRVVGLEWFYRLLKEPRRWRRQMALPRFARAVLRERLKGSLSQSAQRAQRFPADHVL
ncbi:MAG: WecB/TagA/CpsF family glycosyltransferase [Syntrophorhabdus sp.]